MRLALVVPSLLQGGGVPSVARFVKDTALRDGRYDLKLISLSTSARDDASLQLSRPNTWRSGPKVVDESWEGIRCMHVGSVGSEFEFQRYRPRRILSELLRDCDLVQVVCGSPAWANAVTGLGKPVALQVATRARIERRQRDARPQTMSAWWRKAMTGITNALDDHALRKVDAIQVENDWMLRYAQELNRDRTIDLRYAPPGINAALFHPATERPPSTSDYILCVGRLDDPRKRIELLITAYGLLPAPLRERFGILLAGSAAPTPHFWNKVERAGLRDRVTFISNPSMEALVRLYQQARVFVLPSDEEGFGVVLVEAMACGIPVISTRSGGPEGIITDGSDGYLVQLNDAGGMAFKLEQMLRDEARNDEMGRNARRTVEARYDEAVAGQVFVDMWDRLSREGRSA